MSPALLTGRCLRTKLPVATQLLLLELIDYEGKRKLVWTRDINQNYYDSIVVNRREFREHENVMIQVK